MWGPITDGGPHFLMKFFQYVFQDLFRYQAQSRKKLLMLFLFYPGFRSVILYRMSRYFALRKVPYLPILLLNICQMSTGAEIHYNSNIGKGLKIAHPSGIVVGAHVVAGANLTIFQGVTIGARIIMEQDSLKSPKERYPIIGNNVTLYAGAKIIGPITCGDNVTVGANSVVLESVPDNATVVGIPGRIILK